MASECNGRPQVLENLAHTVRARTHAGPWISPYVQHMAARAPARHAQTAHIFEPRAADAPSAAPRARTCSTADEDKAFITELPSQQASAHDQLLAEWETWVQMQLDDLVLARSGGWRVMSTTARQSQPSREWAAVGPLAPRDEERAPSRAGANRGTVSVAPGRGSGAGCESGRRRLHWGTASAVARHPP